MCECVLEIESAALLKVRAVFEASMTSQLKAGSCDWFGIYRHAGKRYHGVPGGGEIELTSVRTAGVKSCSCAWD